jgi:hypothetical protein
MPGGAHFYQPGIAVDSPNYTSGYGYYNGAGQGYYYRRSFHHPGYHHRYSHHHRADR